MAKEIELTQGYKTLVDDIDFEYLRQFHWYYHKGYAECKDSLHKNLSMHRVILERKLGRKLAPGELSDHKDRKPLNNTRDNLRIATRHQNNINSANRRANATSPFRGVFWHKRERKWKAHIKVHKKCIYLGSFDDPVLAAKRYDENAILLHGEFAVLNFPNELKLN